MLDKNLEKLVKILATPQTDNYRNPDELREAIAIIRRHRPDWDINGPEVWKKLSGDIVLANSTELVTSSDAVVNYENIEGTYLRWFFQKWNLNMILKKFSTVYNGIRGVVNSYGRELLGTEPITFSIDYGGMKATVNSPEEVTKILPTNLAQKNGIRWVGYNFETTDGKISGGLFYGCRGFLYTTDGICGAHFLHLPTVWATLEIKEFTGLNMEEYQKIQKVVAKGK